MGYLGALGMPSMRLIVASGTVVGLMLLLFWLLVMAVSVWVLIDSPTFAAVGWIGPSFCATKLEEIDAGSLTEFKMFRVQSFLSSMPNIETSPIDRKSINPTNMELAFSVRIRSSKMAASMAARSSLARMLSLLLGKPTAPPGQEERYEDMSRRADVSE